MKYRRFGKTELQMPVFSCGGMRYQHKWQDVPPHEVPAAGQANLEATIHRALELGINHIETARGYGSSEMQLGWVLPQIKREKLIVQTKVAPFATPEEFLRTFDQSMKYLKLDHVELLSFHGINHRQHLDWTLRKGTQAQFRKLLTEDKARQLMHPVEYDRQSGRLAQGYYAVGQDDQAIFWGEQATKRSGQYIPEIPAVREGLTGSSFWWAWTNSHVGQWHPFTTLSFIFDSSVSGFAKALASGKSMEEAYKAAGWFH
ncbi:MAG: hypothetical protein EB141_00710, partial [Verrucomicrobia bacterium]|nr:hypothetical protein [Verrucomicrobiota bacterium]